MDNIKITEEGFVWLIVTDSAKELFSSGALAIYEIFEDSDSESSSLADLILTREHLDKALESGNEIGVEVAWLPALINSYQYQNL